jgi:hypothetical protein
MWRTRLAGFVLAGSLIAPPPAAAVQASQAVQNSRPAPGVHDVHGTKAPQAVPDVRWEGERLTVHAAATSKVEVLLAVARLAHIEIVGLEHITGTVSADFDRQPLEDGLARLLAGTSFALVDAAGAGALPGATYTLRVTDSAPAAARPSAARTPIVVRTLARVQQDTDIAPDLDEEADAREEEQDQNDDYADAEASGLFDPNAPLGPLVEAVRESDNPLVKIRALQTLQQRDPGRALKPLLEAMTDDDESVAREAVTILGQRSDEPSLRQLEQKVVKSQDISTRVGALQALALRADPACVPALKQVAADRDPLVRAAVAEMLQEFAFRERLARR